MASHIHNKIDSEKLKQIIRDPKVRRALSRACHYWFFHIYFLHYLKCETAPFHKEIFSLTEDERVKNAVVEAFRGSGKTTIMGMSYPIWAILGKQQKKFVLLLAQTQEQARQYLANIKEELEANALLKRDLGPFEEPDDEWRSVSIVIPKYDARIMVASIDKPVRGIRHKQHRPDLIICDDLEDLGTVKTKESRDKIYAWIMGDVIPLGDTTTRFLMIGTRLHEDSVLMQVKRDIIEGRMDGAIRSYPLLNGKGRPLWPDKYKTKADIEALRRSLPNPQAWHREYLLQIIGADDQVIRPEWIQTYDALPMDESSSNFRYAATGVDPAISEKETADFTAMVSARVYGRKNDLRIFILPNPINKRMDFPKTMETIRSLSKTLGNGLPTNVWIEGVAYQKALIDQLVAEGYPAKEFKPQGSDKRARLSLVSHHIQSGEILFPKKGAEPLVAQLTGFSVERHDDLADAFCILILGILERESPIVKGYPLVSEKVLDMAYSTPIPFMGEKRLGVVLAGGSRTHSAIVLRAENAAQVLYHEPVGDVVIVATKIIEFAKQHEIAISDKRIFIDNTGMGEELCSRVKEFGAKEPGVNMRRIPDGRYPSHNYGLPIHAAPWYEAERYTDMRARSFFRLAKWIQTGGKLLGRPAFDDLLFVTYVEQEGKVKIVGNETLAEEGIDASVPEALALTIITDKEPPRRHYVQPPYEPMSPNEYVLKDLGDWGNRDGSFDIDT